MPLESLSSLRILIIGGGVGGLTAALHFRRYGFTLKVVEQKSTYHDGNSGGGLSFTTNATCCFDAVDVGDRFRQIADRGDGLHALRYTDGKLSQYVPGQPRFMVHRADLLNLLATWAEEVGVEMIRGEKVETLDGTTVSLTNGKVIESDLIIGADGIHSKTRDVVFGAPGFQPMLTQQCTFLMYVPRSTMESSQEMQEVYERGKSPIIFSSSPGRSIVAWTMTKREVFHLQVSDHAYRNGRAYGQEDDAATRFVSLLEDTTGLKERWSDHGGAFADILQRSSRCTKWLIAELPDLPRWASEKGHVVLLGDAAHAFPPFAGQGAAMAVEDAAALAIFIARGFKDGLPMRTALAAYEQLRRPRIQLIREVIKNNVAKWSATQAPSPNGPPDKQVIDRGRAEAVREYDPMKEAEAFPWPLDI